MTPIYFNIDKVSVIAEALDCSSALVDNDFKNPPSIEYSSQSSLIKIASSYETIFKHTKKDDCQLLSCSLGKLGSC